MPYITIRLITATRHKDAVMPESSVDTTNWSRLGATKL
jgi:hypothetical protein